MDSDWLRNAAFDGGLARWMCEISDLKCKHTMPHCNVTELMDFTDPFLHTTDGSRQKILTSLSFGTFLFGIPIIPFLFMGLFKIICLCLLLNMWSATAAAHSTDVSAAYR